MPGLLSGDFCPAELGDVLSSSSSTARDEGGMEPADRDPREPLQNLLRIRRLKVGGRGGVGPAMAAACCSCSCRRSSNAG